MIEARYDLVYQIAGHDFYSWLVMAAAKGAERIVFGIENPKETKWTKEIVIERFRSIMEPGPRMVELPYRIGIGGVSNLASPHMVHLVPFVNGGGKIVRVKSVFEPEQNINYTVTLRNEPRVKDMNSNEKDWLKFADNIGAEVIFDYNEAPIHIYKRMAFYAGAKMNFGVVNGPMHMLTLSEYPVTIFKANVSAPNLSKHGIEIGTQLPWARSNQKLIWKDDDYDNLMRNFEISFGAVA